MIASETQHQAEYTEQPTAIEPLVAHLRRIAVAACWAIAPIEAVLLFIGRLNLALSIAGGAFVSFVVFASLRIMVYRMVGLMAPEPGARPEVPGPTAMAQFAIGTIIKFVVAIGVVYLMVRLQANLLALLAGFVVAQIAIAVTVSRAYKKPHA